MPKLLPIVLSGLMLVACAQQGGSRTSSQDPGGPAGANAGSSKETGDTQARHDRNPTDKAPKY